MRSSYEQSDAGPWEKAMKTNAGTWLAGLLGLAVVCGPGAGSLSAVSEARAASAGRKTPPVKYIVKDGRSLGRLYLPAASGKATQFAAQELREHLKKVRRILQDGA